MSAYQSIYIAFIGNLYCNKMDSIEGYSFHVIYIFLKWIYVI